MNGLIPAPVRSRCLAVALSCTLCVFLWQALTVRYSYAGNWTGLFCTGALSPSPPSALSQGLYIFPNSYGYDGQFYRYVAHDPFFRRGFARSIDAPRLRYRRILVPGLAWLLAGGEDRLADAAYIAVVLGFVLLGAYWMSRFGVRVGYGSRLGLLFALVPAVLVSIDRLTVDVALAACCAGFALYARESSPAKLYVVMMAAALTRETGLLLVAGYVLWLLSERRLREAAVFATAALPTACWYIFVALHTTPGAFGFLTAVPFSGIVGRVLHPMPLTDTLAVRIVGVILDLLALCGMAGAMAWAFLKARRRVWTPLTIAIYLFAVLAVFLVPGDPWSDVYSFGRTLTPLLLLSALDGLAGGNKWPSVAMLLVDPRIALQWGSQILKVVQAGIAFRP